MKTKFTIIIALILSVFYVYSQDTIAGWTFPSATSTDSFANYGTAANKTRSLHLTADSMIMFITATGQPAPCAQAMGLTNGTATQKGWSISFSTKGYKNLKLNSAQMACPTHSGPKYWKTQFKIGATGTWTDIPGGKVVCGLNWTTGALSNITIPTACNDNPLIFVRWLMTSDSNVSGSASGTVLVSGGSMSRIDNIFINGTRILTQGDTLVGWTFPNAKLTDTVANLGITINKTKTIRLVSDSAITMLTKTSFSPPACAQAMGMSNATAKQKGWYIEFNAINYKNLKVFSRQMACPTHSGPKYWKIQYKIGTAGTWTDVPSGNIVCGKNWVNAAVTALPLPAACDGSPYLGLRWITTSDSNVTGATNGTPLVTDSSMTRIDDVIITGDYYTGINDLQTDPVFSVYPNPSNGMVNIITENGSKNISVFNSYGQLIFSDVIKANIQLDFSKFGKGIYVIRLQNENYIISKKLIVE